MQSKIDVRIQWAININLFENIKVILDRDEKNIVILDRSPYSDPIWSEFFERDYNISQNFMTYFLNINKDNGINEQILYVSLNVKDELILNRLKQKPDYNNYLSVFNRIYKSDNDNFNEFETDNKVLYVIRKYKHKFYEMEYNLTKYNITVKRYCNDIEQDKHNNALNVIDEIKGI